MRNFIKTPLLIALMLSFYCNISNAQTAKISASLDTTIFPHLLSIHIIKPSIELDRVEYLNNNDAIFNFYFKGCGLSNNNTIFDTIINIYKVAPYSIKIYAIWDTAYNISCSPVTEPKLMDSLIITSDEATGIQERQYLSKDMVAISPNPSQGNVYVTTQPSITVLDVSLYDLMGRRIATWQGATPVISTATLPKGIYMLHLHTLQGIVTEKIEVE